jgi:hypothetical protein
VAGPSIRFATQITSADAKAMADRQGDRGDVGITPLLSHSPPHAAEYMATPLETLE